MRQGILSIITKVLNSIGENLRLLPESFLEAAKKRVLLFDEAMGTEIQRLEPKEMDFPDGKDWFNDGLILSSQSDKEIHRSYLKAGATALRPILWVKQAKA